MRFPVFFNSSLSSERQLMDEDRRDGAESGTIALPGVVGAARLQARAAAEESRVSESKESPGLPPPADGERSGS